MSMGIWDFLGGLGTGGLGFLAGAAGSNSSAWDPFHIFTKSDSQKLSEEQWEWQTKWLNKNYVTQDQWKHREYDAAMRELQYQHDLNTMQMQREDDAVRRRVADLQAAGLSPTLAAGSAASATPVHAGNVPHIDAPQHGIVDDPRVQAAMFKESMMKDRMALALTAMGNIADVSRTKAETEFIKAQTGHQDIINKFEEDRLSTTIEGTRLENDAKRMANSFNQLANPARLTEMRQAIDLAKNNIDIAQLDKEIKTNEKLRQIYYNSEAKFKAALAGKQVELADLNKENIDWDTALKIYSLEYAKDRMVPIGGNPSMWGEVHNVGAILRHIFYGK